MESLNIPAELTEFVPEKIELAPLPSWEVRSNDFDDSVEIHNVLFSGRAIVWLIEMIVFMTFIGSLGTVMLHFMGDVPGPVPKTLFLVAFWFTGYFVTGLIFSLLLYMTSCNGASWKSGLRFRFDKSSGELFFPRENARYAREDCDVLILGTVDGYDTPKIQEQIELNKTKSKKQTVLPSLTTEIYFLVHRIDGTWVRHLVGYAPSSKATRRAVAKIQKAVDCTAATRTMSLSECHTTQNRASEGALPPLPPRGDFVGYCIGILFMIVGLGIAGFGFHHLYHASASLTWKSCEGIVNRAEIESSRTGGQKSHTNHKAVVHYEYVVDGKKHLGDNYRYGMGAYTDAGPARRIVAAHPVGSSVKVYYSPTSPQKSVLVPGASWEDYLLCGFGTVFFLLGLGVFLMLRRQASRLDVSKPFTLSEPILHST